MLAVGLEESFWWSSWQRRHSPSSARCAFLVVVHPAPVAFPAVTSDHPGSACLCRGEDVPDASRALHADPWVPAHPSLCRSL